MLGALLTAACGTDLSVARIEVGRGLVQAGDTVRLTATGYSAGGSSFATSTVTAWASSDTAVVRLERASRDPAWPWDNQVLARGVRPGVARVTAVMGGEAGAALVHVLPPLAVAATPAALVVAVGDSARVEVAVGAAEGASPADPVPGLPVDWNVVDAWIVIDAGGTLPAYPSPVPGTAGRVAWVVGRVVGAGEVSAELAAAVARVPVTVLARATPAP